MSALLKRRDVCLGLAMFLLSTILLIGAAYAGSHEGVETGAFAMPFTLGWLLGRL